MLEKLFGFNAKETTVRTEIMAGITTFLTMAYILAVHPSILGETGMDKGALFTTTVIMSAIPSIFMGIYAKLPLDYVFMVFVLKNDTLHMRHKVKRYIFMPKTGVVKPNGIFYCCFSHFLCAKNHFSL